MPYKSDAQRRAVWAKKTEEHKKKKKKNKLKKTAGKFFKTYYITKDDFENLSSYQQEHLYDILKDEDWITMDETQALVGKYFPNKEVDIVTHSELPVHHAVAEVPSSSTVEKPLIYLNTDKNPKKVVLHELGHAADYYNENSSLRKFDKRNNWFRRLIRDKKLRELNLQLENDAWDWAGIDEKDKLREFAINTYKESLGL